MDNGLLYLHLYTWPECWQMIEEKKVLVDLQGYALGHNRCTENEAFTQWYKSVGYAIQGNKDVPVHVVENYEAQGKPTKINVLEKPMAPKFTWSYTALTSFENCPLSYAHQKYYKDVPFIETEALKDGNRKHTALELYAKGIAQPASELALVAPHTKYVDAFKAAGGTLQAEREITLTESMKPTGWFSKDAWFRIKLDITLLRGNRANIYDWKTGKQKDDVTQLQLCCATLAIVEPEIEEFTAKNIWLKNEPMKQVDGGVKLHRSELKKVWMDTLARVHRMRQAWDSEVWQPKPSGLCPYCAYAPKCKYRR